MSPNKLIQTIRRAVATNNGYVPRPLPEDVPWAGYRTPEELDRQSHEATLAIRGINPGEDT